MSRIFSRSTFFPYTTLFRSEIVRGVSRGLYVTSMMGFGFNAVTGDFSRGAEGFWIENGEKTFPVGEITIRDRKSTRLNSSHGYISYAVFCLKKKTQP